MPQLSYDWTRGLLQPTAAFEAQLGCPSLATLFCFIGIRSKLFTFV